MEDGEQPTAVAAFADPAQEQLVDIAPPAAAEQAEATTQHGEQPPAEPAAALEAPEAPGDAAPSTAQEPAPEEQPKEEPAAPEEQPKEEPAAPSPRPPPAPPATQRTDPLAAASGRSAGGVRSIDVTVDRTRRLHVLLDASSQDRKPFLGGYRHHGTGAVYHHASSQTPRQPRNVQWALKFSRETQTVHMKTRSQQSVREAATQMVRPDCVIEDETDVLISPRPYFDAAAVMAVRDAAARTVQRYTRGWLGRRRAAYLARLRAEAAAYRSDMAAKDAAEAEADRKVQLTRRLKPLHSDDFATLYRELEAWRLKETARIKDVCLPQEQEHAALEALLHKETKLLQTIERLRINANHANAETGVQALLAKMASPKRWQAANGIQLEVHTPYTTRALELMQLYNGLIMPALTTDERLDVLLHVKWTVKEFECRLTREVVELIDREADILNRGRSAATLEGLRKRIASLFLAFVKTPEFNPEASRIKKASPADKGFVFPERQYATQKAEPVPIKIL